jgi:guanylate kinase
MSRKLVILSAPSGAGKTTIAKYLLEQIPSLSFSVSACSRKKRPHEVEGRDYYFLSAGDFRKKIENDEFVEWEEVYKDNFYGTLKSETERIWSLGKSILFDVDVKGGMNIKKQYGSNALLVFVMPPSIGELKKRLLKRSTESSESIRERVEKAEAEIKFAPMFDARIVNDDLDSAKANTLKMVREFLEG